MRTEKEIIEQIAEALYLQRIKESKIDSGQFPKFKDLGSQDAYIEYAKEVYNIVNNALYAELFKTVKENESKTKDQEDRLAIAEGRIDVIAMTLNLEDEK